QRVRPGRDRLRFQRLGGPRVGHLRGDDAVQVLLEADDVDCAELPSVDVDLDRAAISVSERQRLGPRLEDQRADERLRLRRAVEPAAAIRRKSASGRRIEGTPNPRRPTSGTRTRVTKRLTSSAFLYGIVTSVENPLAALA